MGTMRFTLFGIWRLIFLRRFFGSFYYLNSNVPSDRQNPNLRDSLDQNIYTHENSIK